MLYHKVIQQHVHRYIEVQGLGSDRACKTMIAVEILHLLHDKYQSRFLSRENSRWVAIDDAEAQVKVSQALRNLARKIVTQKR